MGTRKKGFALITGAAGGLGSAFSLEAARQGWGLVLVDLPGCGLRETGRKLARAYRVEAHSFEMDLVDGCERRRLAQWIGDQMIEVDLLINTAPMGPSRFPW